MQRIQRNAEKFRVYQYQYLYICDKQIHTERSIDGVWSADC